MTINESRMIASILKKPGWQTILFEYSRLILYVNQSLSVKIILILNKYQQGLNLKIKYSVSYLLNIISYEKNFICFNLGLSDR